LTYFSFEASLDHKHHILDQLRSLEAQGALYLDISEIAYFGVFASKF